MQFKIGDRVKILQRATSVGVEQEEVGKIGVISSINDLVDRGYGIKVQMSEICKIRGYVPKWNVGATMIELYPTKNQQLLFNFMED